MGTGSAKCKYEPCYRSTTSVYCYQHWYKNFSDTEEGFNSGRLKMLARQSHVNIEGRKSVELAEVVDPTKPTQIWADAKKVFIDIQDEIDPEGIRNQVRGYAESSATTAALRFARDERLEVDPALRDKHIENFTSDVVSGLTPNSDLVSQEDAEFISGAIASDGLGGSSDFDDAKALIAYGIRKEWELANAEGIKESSDEIPYNIPYEKFLSVVYSNDIAVHIVVASRREASDFHENVVIATGSKAANPTAVNPKNALPSRAEAEPITSAYFDEAREWVKTNREEQDSLQKAQEAADELAEARMRERQEAVAAVIDGGVNLVKGTFNAFRIGGQAMDKLFGTRPEDIRAQNDARNKRNRDIYFEMQTRRERQRRGMW